MALLVTCRTCWLLLPDTSVTVTVSVFSPRVQRHARQLERPVRGAHPRAHAPALRPSVVPLVIVRSPGHRPAHRRGVLGVGAHPGEFVVPIVQVMARLAGANEDVARRIVRPLVHRPPPPAFPASIGKRRRTGRTSGFRPRRDREQVAHPIPACNPGS